MDIIESTIRAYRASLTGYRFQQPRSFAEDFAQKRFLKKMEVPDVSRESLRRANAWKRFIDIDGELPICLKHPPGVWYKARLLAHEALKQFRMAPLVITNGSEFTPTFGRNSVESKLKRSSWDCTRGNLDLFVDLVSRERGLRVALRKRFESLVTEKGFSPKEANRFIYRSVTKGWTPDQLKDRRRLSRACLRFKAIFVCNFVEGSRFSTVRKNNEKNRPINIEGLCNVLVQRSIGNGIRNVLLDVFGLDLDHDAEKHRGMIRDLNKATIDLSDASDSVSVALCEFLFPRWFFDLLMQSRSPLILGPDRAYHDLRKISSMGNGFTFELMSLILCCVGRCFDPDFSVFGDDIIIAVEQAPAFIKAIESVGFRVNEDKTFITGPFRESCGANYHAEEGYIESFDFEYPESIGDCVSLLAKATYLAEVYESFVPLRNSLRRAVPKPLQGGELLPAVRRAQDHPPIHSIPNYFATGCEPVKRGEDGEVDMVIDYLRYAYQIPGAKKFRIFKGFGFVSGVVSPTLRDLDSSRHWAKYFMYLSAGGVTHDHREGDGVWSQHRLVQFDGITIRWSRAIELFKREQSLVLV